MYGAHLLRNGAALIITELMQRGWVTHLATNGAGSIHDWEFSWLGRSCEGVEDNVADGTFGMWEETGRNIHLALLAGDCAAMAMAALSAASSSKMAAPLPNLDDLHAMLTHPDERAPAAAELLLAMQRHGLAAGQHQIEHRWPQASLLAQAHRLGVPPPSIRASATTS